MKHVPNGREESKKQPGTGPKDRRRRRKTARDGTPEPMKERAVPTASKVVI